MTAAHEPIGTSINVHLMLGSTPPQVTFRRDDDDPNAGYLAVHAEGEGASFHRLRVCVSGTQAELETVLLTALAAVRQVSAPPATAEGETAVLEVGARAASGSPLPEPLGVAT